MNAKLIIAGVAALVVIAAGLLVFLNVRSKDPTPASQLQSQDTNERTSISDLLAKNQPLRCTYDITDGASQSSATVYIDGKRLRGDITVQSGDDAAQTSRILQDNTHQYIWTEGSKMGIKAKTSTPQPADSQLPTNVPLPQGVDPNQEYEFDCVPWTVDESVFKAPSNIKFTDYSAQAQQAPELQKEACRQISDRAARAACEAAVQ